MLHQFITDDNDDDDDDDDDDNNDDDDDDDGGDDGDDTTTTTTTTATRKQFTFTMRLSEGRVKRKAALSAIRFRKLSCGEKKRCAITRLIHGQCRAQWTKLRYSQKMKCYNYQSNS